MASRNIPEDKLGDQQKIQSERNPWTNNAHILENMSRQGSIIFNHDLNLRNSS